MWEAIERNKRRSWMLLALMGALLLALGYVIGAAIYIEYAGVKQLGVGYVEYHQVINRGLEGEDMGSPPRFFEWTKEPGLLLNGGGVIGLGVAALIWAILTSVAFFSGDRAILWTAGALEIQREDAPRVWNVVEEMTIAAGLAKPPRVFLIDDDGMNAFAVGLSPDHAGVAVTSGLVKRMSRDELQGVVAHEIGHIHNYDIRFMTLASIMMGSIVLVSEVFLRSLRHVPRRSSSSKSGGGAQVILLVVAVLFAVLAPFAAQILYFACSRKREYLADACAARFTRYPPGLASALERIGREGKATGAVKRGLAPLYTVNPLQPMSASSLFSSHPPLEKRIAILRSMGGAGYAEYERAFHEVVPTAKPCIESTVVENDSVIGIRAPQQDVVAGNDIDRSREVLDVIDRAAQYLFIPCACGVRLKMPPGMSRTELKCPNVARATRCRTQLNRP
ncbi:MAG: M48 family metallopeptidase [Planctomycetes bacterium]|nr:M48 family metallopeptidase [Planctomycetota bacterium]